ncbi:MAG: hypothetical protein GX273_09295 [Bacteroidales bacterium]|nr:hypothetical protein [Bacteroidales bacterium]
MARGKSGRIVLEVDPKLKKDLYLELARREQTLKDWFVAEANNLAYNGAQTDLFKDSNPNAKDEKKV